MAKKAFLILMTVMLMLGMHTASIADSSISQKLRFDGLYYCISKDEQDNQSFICLRFYEDMWVIKGTFEEELPKQHVFNRDDITFRKGHSDVIGNRLHFSVWDIDHTAVFDVYVKQRSLLADVHYLPSDKQDVEHVMRFVSFKDIEKGEYPKDIDSITGDEWNNAEREKKIASGDIRSTSSTQDEEEQSVNGNRSIILTAKETTIGIKKQITIKAEIKRLTDDAPKKSTLIWISSDPRIAEVTNKGVVKGIEPGQAIITCQLEDDPSIKATKKINVVIPIQRITSSQKKMVVYETGAQKWDLKIEPSNATNTKLVFSSSNDKVSVHEDGGVYGIKKGKAKVTATANDGSGKKLSLDVIVEPALPLTIDSIGHGIYRNDLLGITVISRSESKTIVGFSYEIYFYDFSGNIINGGNYKLSKLKILPGTRQSIDTSIFGSGQAYRTSICISSVDYSDGTSWIIPEAYQEKLEFTRR